MTTWRMPSTVERERDRRHLASFLDPSIAGELADMPVVDFAEQLAPFALRADAWLWRVERLLTTSRRRDVSEVAA